MRDRWPPERPGSGQAPRPYPRVRVPAPRDDSDIDTVVDYNAKQRREAREGETIPNTDTPPLGQADVIASIRSFLHSVETSGKPALLLLIGETGSGKTELLDYGEKLVGRLIPDAIVLKKDRWRSHFENGSDGSRRTTVVLLDDFHDAVPDDWQALQEIGQTEVPCAFLLTGEPTLIHRVSELGFSGRVTVRSIEPLDEQGVGIVVESLVGNLQGDSEPLISALTHRSRGNPRLLREIVRSLVKTDLFVRAAKGGFTINLPRLASGELPLTLEDAVYARLRRLDPFERATLERAAVVGEAFWDGAVLAQMRHEDDSLGSQNGKNVDPVLWSENRDFEVLGSALRRLEGKGFIEGIEDTDIPGVALCRFCYPELRSRVYSTVDETLRTKRHSAVSEWLQVVCQGQGEFAARLASHLERGGHKSLAGRAHLEAAIYERSRLRTTVALRHGEKALSLIPQSEVILRLDAFHEWGALLSTLGRLEDALEAFHRMFILAWRIGASGRAGAALSRIARVHRDRGDSRQAKNLLERSLRLFRGAGDLRGVAATLDDLGIVYLLLGETQAAAGSSREALEIRRAHGDRRGEAVSLTTLGLIELSRGNLEGAAAMLQKGSAIRQEIGDHEGLVQSRTAAGLLASERGDLEDALRLWREALDQAREMGGKRSECFLLIYIGEVLISQGAIEEAADHLKTSYGIAEKLGDRQALAEVQRVFGILAIRRGDTSASMTIERAKELAEDYGSSDGIARCYLALGQLRGQTLYDGTGNIDRSAEENFLESMRLFREAGNEKGFARALAALGYHLVERGDHKSARIRLREARSLMRRMGLGDLQRVEQVLAELG